MQYMTWQAAREKVSELVALWNTELGERFPMQEELFRQNSIEDCNIYLDGSYIALNEAGLVIGFVISKLWQEEAIGFSLGEGVGWIQALMVSSEYRERGIGSTLLSKAEKALQEAGVRRTILGRDPWHYLPGIPEEDNKTKAWFEQRGYLYSKTVTDLTNSYGNDSLVELPMFEGVTIRLLNNNEQEKLLCFLKHSFPGRWTYEAIKYFERGGTGREYVVLVKGEDIIGFCRINDPDSPFIAQNVYWSPMFDGALGGIGPLGIDRAYRKNGYGIAIVQAGIHFLLQRGVKYIVIDWTELINFYGKLGFKPWKSYAQYEKEILIG